MTAPPKLHTAARDALAAALATGEQRAVLAANLRRRYEAGASIRTLARAEDLSCIAIRKLLTEAKTTIRTRGGDTTHLTPRIPAEERESLALRLRTAYEEGASIRQVAFTESLPDSLAYRLLQESGTQFRSRGCVPEAERPALAASIRRDYEDGASIRQLAAERHLAYGTIHALLLEARTQLRPRYARPCRMPRDTR